jgi:hypothetical protein
MTAIDSVYIKDALKNDPCYKEKSEPDWLAVSKYLKDTYRNSDVKLTLDDLKRVTAEEARDIPIYIAQFNSTLSNMRVIGKPVSAQLICYFLKGLGRAVNYQEMQEPPSDKMPTKQGRISNVKILDHLDTSSTCCAKIVV